MVVSPGATAPHRACAIPSREPPLIQVSEIIIASWSAPTAPEPMLVARVIIILLPVTLMSILANGKPAHWEFGRHVQRQCNACRLDK